MAEKINIATLDIDVKSLLNETQKVKKEIDSLKKQQDILTKSGETSSKQYIQNASDLKALSSVYSQNTKALAENTKAVKDETSAEERLNLVLNKEVKTIKEARDQNKLLNKLRNETNATTKEGQAQIQLLNNQLDKNNNFIKDNGDQYLKQKINIGNYQGAISKLSPKLGALTASLQSITGGLIAKKEALKATTFGLSGASKALKIFKIALISTGIGAIVVALGSLIAAFASTQKGIDFISKALAPLKGAFQAIIGVVQDLAVNIFGQLKDRFTIVKNSILIGVDLIRLAWNKLTGDIEEASEIQEQMKTRVKETREAQDRLNKKTQEFSNILSAANKRISEGAKIQSEIVRLNIKAEKIENDLILLRAKNLSLIKSAELIAKDRNKTDEERNKAVQDAIKLSNELKDAENTLLSTQIKSKELQQSINDTDRKETKELNELKAKQISLQEEADKTRLRFLGVENQLENERIKRIEDSINKQIKQQEDELSLLKEQSRLSSKELDSRLKKQELFSKKEIEILTKKLENNLITQTQYNIQVQKIENDLQEKRNELREKELNNQRDFESKRDELLESIRLKREENDQVNQEIELNKEFEKQKLELLNLEISEIQKTELLKLLETDRELALQEIRDNFRQEEINKIQEYFNEQIRLGATVTEIEKQQANTRANIAATLTNTLKGLLGEGVAAQLASIAIDAAVQSSLLKLDAASATGRIASSIGVANAKAIALSPLTAGQPFVSVNTAQGAGLLAALQTQTALSQAKIIQSAAVRGIGSIAGGLKFEKGGIVGIDGKSHSQGGVPIFAGNKYVGEAEGGEGIGILSRPAFGSFMDFNNEFGKGKIGTTFAQQGGIMTTGLNEQGLKESDILELISNMPRPIVYVEDIKTSVLDTDSVEVMADI